MKEMLRRMTVLLPRKSVGACAVAMFIFAIPVGKETLAQQLSSAFGGFAANPDEPIDIQANRLDVDDKAKRAVFTGNVTAVQDTFTMNSSTLEVRYAARSGAAKKQPTGFGGGSTEITQLIARGRVFVESAKQEPQTATGDWAEFDVKKRIITMGDLVTLKQGKNVIRGTRLVINLNTGRSSVLSNDPAASKKGGRIRMVITPDKALRNRVKQPSKKQRSKGSASQPLRSNRTNQ
ncbi:MAG: LptA/OstA family protein [Hyphomicrobiaceae bacterium]